jgi:4-methylaminobutanoate oxidase (formaldehyde-forming)
MLWGGELILRGGEPVGQLTSAAFGHTVGAAVALGYVANPTGIADAQWLLAGQYEIDVAGERFAARASLKAPYDPDGKRVRA